MIYFLLFTLTSTLFILIYEDFKYRAVHWYLFPVITIIILAVNWIQNLLPASIYNLTLNIAFILIQFALVTLYFSLRTRRVLNIFKNHLGVGDLLFLLSITPAFSTVNFILFYASSLLIVVLTYIVVVWHKKNKEYQIPLAGAQAILFLLLIIYDFFSTKFNLHCDLRLLIYAVSL